jgi:penicillin G amidase
MRKLMFLALIALAGSIGIDAAPAELTLRVPGLGQPVEILKDRWGLNHIFAQSESDLFFAQGYAAARDRLFQFELWRRQATGTVADMLGRKELKRDIGTRLHMFRGDLKTELEISSRAHPPSNGRDCASGAPRDVERRPLSARWRQLHRERNR